MKNFFKTLILCGLLCVSFASCKKDKEDPVTGGDKPTIENLAVNPSSSVTYGDLVTLTGKFTDQSGLQSYTVIISNAQGEIYNDTKMLTGTSYNLNESIVIPLPKNAQAGNVGISISVKNGANVSATDDLTINSVAVPVFGTLYLVIGTKTYTMEKDGDVFSVDDLISAGAVGKIYVNADKSGLFWGKSGEDIVSMGSGDIAIGGESDANMVITFNPVTFAFAVGDSEEQWAEIAETFYIYGEISGHWQDGDIITELASAKMKGFQSGDKKRWTWTPPSLDEEDPNNGVAGFDMWGSINPGAFRFKKAGSEEYILLDNGNIVTGATNERTKSFVTSAGGLMTITLHWDGTKYNMVSLEADDKSLDFIDGGNLNINGAPAPASITFAGANLTLREGTLYVYEGLVDLTNGQNITSSAGLDKINPDPDVFFGRGNSTWTMEGSTGEWIVRIDPFGFFAYACKQSGYPDVIYMDGWGWAKFDGDPATNWIPENRLCLQRKDGSSYIYEAVFYNYGWGIDGSFWAAPAHSDPDFRSKIIAVKYFTGVTPYGVGSPNMLLPGSGYMKVTVDLKDGFTYDEETLDVYSNGEYYTLMPTNDKQFTVTFDPIAAPW